MNRPAEKLKEKFPSEILSIEERQNETAVLIKKERALEILQFLRDDPDCRFEFLMDLCGVDRSKLGELIRFEVVYHLYSLTHNHRIRIRAKVPEGEDSIDSVIGLWKSADWFERECWEMFGIEFVGHPHLKHLLLFEGFEGYPLRKDYPITRRQKIPQPEETL